MDNRPDIWRHLQDEQITPPPELFDSLYRTLHPENEEHQGSLERLQRYSLEPPEFLHKRLFRLIREETHPSKKVLLRRIFLYLRKPQSYAAAFIVLLAGGWFFMRSRVDRRHRPPAIAGLPAANTSRKEHTDTAEKEVAKTIDTVSSSAMAPPGEEAATTNSAHPRRLRLLMGGRSLPLTGDDLLATFTSYTQPAVAACFRDMPEMEDQDMRLHVDQYAEILLSAGMKHMIKEMYETRSNGSPTRGARKTKQKIEKWRTVDARQFDNFLSNPLDPVDLTGFLYPPLFSFNKKTPTPPPATGEDVQSTQAPARPASDLTVSYGISMPSTKSDDGINETYNGGMQTLFASGGRGRLRLVTLMRIQSIYVPSGRSKVTIVKESGRKARQSFTASEWRTINRKYKDATFSNTGEKASILGHSCDKALITLKDGKKLTVWYTPKWQSQVSQLLQPEFALVPGLVLQYEYTCRRKTVRYTATAISERPIDPAVFDIN